MRLLPTSLWLLVAAHIDAQAQLPTAIRKMSPESGEKFFPEYYAFADGEGYADFVQSPPIPADVPPPTGAVAARRTFDDADARLLAVNASAQLGLRPPFAPHRALDEAWDLRNRAADVGGPGDGLHAWRLWFGRAAEALARLERRDWACPAGTSSCESIGYPDSCCQAGEMCVIVTDTGLGSVGCCPSGTTCSGTVSDCANGSTACPSSLGGGCCIAGYVCEGVGCVLSSISSTSSAPASVPPTASVLTLTTTSTSVLSDPTLSTVVVTIVVTETASIPSAVTSTTTETVSASPGSTATTGTTAQTSTNSGAVPPVRPTSSSGTNSAYCPTGFYPCLASAGGGCCQTGRDCNTTSCPPLSYTTIVETNGVTVVVPLPVPSSYAAGTTAGADSCASGWFLCGTGAGPVAGCCPSGYSCGTASCSLATLGGTATVAKELPGSGAGRAAVGRELRAVWAVSAVLVLALLV